MTTPKKKFVVATNNGKASKKISTGKGHMKKPESKPVPELTPGILKNEQLGLFQNLLANTNEQRGTLSNVMDLWDSIPRYSISRQAMRKMRGADGNLKLLKHDFQYRKQPLRIVIQGARLEIEDKNGVIQEIDFYPSANEELVEDALRKIAAEQQQGYLIDGGLTDDRNSHSGVVFTLHMLREELKRQGHTRSLQEIKLSLDILSNSIIKIEDGSKKYEEPTYATSTFFPLVARVNGNDDRPGATWLVQFHSLVAKSIDQLTYRQFNYSQMMSHKSQLARWLHKQLSLKFTFAALGETFVMHFATIKRDSALLSGYGRDRDAVDAVDKAFKELQDNKVLMVVEKAEKRGKRNQLEDVAYKVSPSREFVADIKAANKRIDLIKQKEKPPVDNSQN